MNNVTQIKKQLVLTGENQNYELILMSDSYAAIITSINTGGECEWLWTTVQGQLTTLTATKGTPGQGVAEKIKLLEYISGEFNQYFSHADKEIVMKTINHLKKLL